jgi:acetyl esterase/lipase
MAIPLLNTGFIVLQARYPGSWQSYGKFGPSSSITGAIKGLELLSKGKAIDLATEKAVEWSYNRLVLVGNSYGGGVAASTLALTDLAESAVLFCPLLEPANQNTDKTQPEDDLTTLLPYLKRCHENIFRDIDESEWVDFLKGRSVLNPPVYIETLRNRKLLLVHGQEDKTIRSFHTENFYNNLITVGATRTELLLVNGVGHGKALRSKTCDYWTNWILS